ncbi:MAG: hypothetical protein B6U95_03705 [Thermofilum sp. ex4484_82]|nr:MAG: hypothetical protein B6U95_03705 [Thermofilum sp. ex4484_82]OYT38727.1 MAG: hypothetical protein B6U96_03695 [Archaeoglobales archaeon ex4484_92]RLE85778.1 MAG: DUF488 domain-containing protein [Thermoprotei archaeon]
MTKQKAINNEAEIVEVYTIGHSNRSLKDFIEILNYYRIGVVIDIRRFPTSSKYPHFKKEVLKAELENKGISYVWLGEELGGFRSGGYRQYMKSEEYKAGIRKLSKIIIDSSKKGLKIALMCSEKLWFKCHRRHISDTLLGMGYSVVHIIDKEKTYVHKTRLY